ncbi:MAG: hypothetical protein ACLQFR_13620 [Streptosporangiaceae bacterium]
MTIAGPRKKDPSCTVRRVFVFSSARAEAAEHARARKLDRARADLGRVERGLGSRHYNTAAKVTARINAIARDRRVGDYLRATAGSGQDGPPTLDWHFDQAAIDAETAADGWYALLTNLPRTVTAEQVLTRYKNQPGISERRYHDFKGPLAVAPMFLHANLVRTAPSGPTGTGRAGVSIQLPSTKVSSQPRSRRRRCRHGRLRPAGHHPGRPSRSLTGD